MVNVTLVKDFTKSLLGVKKLKIVDYNAFKRQLNLNYTHKVIGFLAVRINGIIETKKLIGYDAGRTIHRDVVKKVTNLLKNKSVYLYEYNNMLFIFGVGESSTKCLIEMNSCCDIIENVLGTPYVIKKKTVALSGTIGGILAENVNGVAQRIIDMGYDNVLHESNVVGKRRNITNYKPINHYEKDELLNIIRNNEINIVMQPIVDPKTKKIFGSEVFMRFENMNKKTYTPEKMVEWADDAGIGLDLDLKILSLACSEIKKWENYDKKPELLSINVSKKSLQNKEFVDNVQEILFEFGVEPSRIGVEIDGTYIGEQFSVEYFEVITKLKRIGFTIIIDDFVRSNFSINNLVRYPIDFIKLDGSLIHKLEKDTKITEMIEGLIKLGKSIGIKVIAEEVENANQLDILKKLGCDYAQGHALYSPINTAVFERILQSKSDNKVVHLKNDNVDSIR